MKKPMIAGILCGLGSVGAADLPAPAVIKAGDEELSQKFNDHYRSREKFVEETYTGFVWLYLQK